MVNLMSDKGRNILLLVEGAKAEVKLFERIIECFPEIKLSSDNILVYNTNLWALNANLEKRFGEEWYDENDISFRDYIDSVFPEVRNKKITDMFLVFDYERQDPLFDSFKLEKMLSFFNDSIENGQLYISYPMIEAYKHLGSLPDKNYKNKICFISDITSYKETVDKESKFKDIRKLDREFFQQCVVQNVKKISYVLHNNYELTEQEILDVCNEIDFGRIAEIQNEYSENETGFIYILCTCILFICNYNKKLIFDK